MISELALQNFLSKVFVGKLVGSRNQLIRLRFDAAASPQMAHPYHHGCLANAMASLSMSYTLWRKWEVSDISCYESSMSFSQEQFQSSSLHLDRRSLPRFLYRPPLFLFRARTSLHSSIVVLRA